MSKTIAQLQKEVAKLKAELESSQQRNERLIDRNAVLSNEIENSEKIMHEYRQFAHLPPVVQVKQILDKLQLPVQISTIKQVAAKVYTVAKEMHAKHETTAKYYANNMRDLSSALTDIAEGNTVYSQFNQQ